MFTPGFKFFAGLATIGLIGTFIYGFSSGDVTGPDYFGFVDRNAVIGLISLGWKGNVGAGLGFFVLIFFSMTAGFLGTTVVAFRDADVESVAELGGSAGMPPAQRPTAPSWWPAAAAVGVGVLLIGLVLDTKAFWVIGLALLALVALEWMFTAWADRSTGSAGINDALRDRVSAPYEIPLFAAVAGGAVALAISRVLLNVTELGAVAVAGVFALAICIVAVIAAFRPQVGRRTIGALVGVLALVIIGLGVLTAALGPREIHPHGHETEDHSEETTVEAE